MQLARPVLNLVTKAFTNYKVESALVKLAQGKKDINEICNDHSEIYRFTMLIDSLNKASTLKKANVLKDLYLSFEGADKTDESDDLFYEILSILSELSDREIRLIYLLERFDMEDIQNKKDNTNYSKYFLEITEEGCGVGGDKSDSFYYFVSDQMEIDPVIISGLMKRLERSGLIVEAGINGNAKFQKYQHTALYKEIKSRLILAMENSYGAENSLTSDDI